MTIRHDLIHFQPFPKYPNDDPLCASFNDKRFKWKSNLLDHFACASDDGGSTKDPACWCTEPFFGHINFETIGTADPADHCRIGLLRLLSFLFGGSCVGISNCATTSALRRLFPQQSIDCIHLLGISWMVSHNGYLEYKLRTFSSSFRFSLRFFLRRAISARLIARSSAVKCFLTWGSVG